MSLAAIFGSIPVAGAIITIVWVFYEFASKYSLGLHHDWLVEVDARIIPTVNSVRTQDRQIDLSREIKLQVYLPSRMISYLAWLRCLVSVAHAKNELTLQLLWKPIHVYVCVSHARRKVDALRREVSVSLSAQ